jgi:hypothetical protein
MPKRRVKTDEERRKTGTLKPGRSEAAYDREFAERKILPFPTLREIPPPTLPLNEIGVAKYNELARMLLDAERLTTLTQAAAEHLAAHHMATHIELNNGKVPAANRLQQIRHLMDDLGINRIDKPVGVRQRPAENPFAANGFASRRAKPVDPPRGRRIP